MGIHGLQSWVDEHCAEVCNLTSVPPGSVILIDGVGLAYHALEQEPQAKLGSYAALDATLQAMLRNLQNSGLQPVIYFDGPRTRLKCTTLDSRRTQRAKRSEKLQALCMDGQQVEPSQLPEPLLMLAQLEASVAACGVPIQRCEGEADPELARACCMGGDSHWLLADDSDFYAYRNVRYIRFSQLSLQMLGGAALDGELRPLHWSAPAAAQLCAFGLCWTVRPVAPEPTPHCRSTDMAQQPRSPFVVCGMRLHLIAVAPRRSQRPE